VENERPQFGLEVRRKNYQLLMLLELLADCPLLQWPKLLSLLRMTMMTSMFKILTCKPPEMTAMLQCSLMVTISPA
jgi:hypothetical protein